MSMDTSSKWPQAIGVVKTMDQETRPSNNNNVVSDQRKATKPDKDQIVNCPRCSSTNTKFCYYNNYSLTQPRYFCKGCRRYWTAGGSLRNVPVGGGSRKNKRSSSSSSHSQGHKFNQTGHDLNLLAYPSNNFSKFIALPPNKTPTFSSMDLLKNHHHDSIATSMGLGSYMPMPVSDSANPIYTSLGFSMQEFKPTLNFSLEGFENNGYGPTSLHEVQHNIGDGNVGDGTSSSSARLLFPFEELNKQVSNASQFDHHNGSDNRSSHGDSNGYWNGMLSGGGTW